MAIPKIIHQTWKDSNVPSKWKNYQKKVQDIYPDWEYRLWTDEDCFKFVEKEFPEFNDIFKNFNLHIMRVDVVRYLIMYKIGGMYLDLDYEFLKKYDFEDKKIVLPKNRSKSYGDEIDGLGNSIFASEPGHQFWKDTIFDLTNNTPVIKDYTEVIESTGPLFLTRLYYANEDKYNDITLSERLIFHPPSPKTKKEERIIKANNTSYGIHHGWGSWKDRMSLVYFKVKFKKIFGVK